MILSPLFRGTSSFTNDHIITRQAQFHVLGKGGIFRVNEGDLQNDFLSIYDNLLHI